MVSYRAFQLAKDKHTIILLLVFLGNLSLLRRILFIIFSSFLKAIQFLLPEFDHEELILGPKCFMHLCFLKVQVFLGDLIRKPHLLSLSRVLEGTRCKFQLVIFPSSWSAKHPFISGVFPKGSAWWLFVKIIKSSFVHQVCFANPEVFYSWRIWSSIYASWCHCWGVQVAFHDDFLWRV